MQEVQHAEKIGKIEPKSRSVGAIHPSWNTGGTKYREPLCTICDDADLFSNQHRPTKSTSISKPIPLKSLLSAKEMAEHSANILKSVRSRIDVQLRTVDMPVEACAEERMVYQVLENVIARGINDAIIVTGGPGTGKSTAHFSPCSDIFLTPNYSA